MSQQPSFDDDGSSLSRKSALRTLSTVEKFFELCWASDRVAGTLAIGGSFYIDLKYGIIKPAK